MISFVWSDPLPIYSGRGGSESFTIGQIRELMSRGIETRIITIGLGKHDGREFFPDIEFHDIKSQQLLRYIDDTLIFVSRPLNIRTKNKSYVMLHTQPYADPRYRNKYKDALRDKTIITNSKFAQKLWAEYLSIPPKEICVVYPFADPAFAKVKRRKLLLGPRRVNVLFAGRLCGEKGIYTFLESLHHDVIQHGYRFTVTTAGNQTPDGKMLENLLRHHNWINLVDARHNPKEMARLFSKNHIVVMPSNPRYWTDIFGYWRETFGMISIEAQHSGCYVVASNDGGLRETDCGGLLLFEPSNSYSLALTIQKAANAKGMSEAQRKKAATHFTRAESVNALLAILKKN